jgi:Glycosyltransferase
MRILILTNNGLGLYKFRRELIERLAEEHEVLFSVPNDDFVKKTEKLGGRFIDNPYLERHSTNPFKDLKLFYYYKRIIKESNPDIVFTYTIKPNVYGGMACAGLNVPYVVNITGLGSAIEKKGIIQCVALTLYKVGLRKAQKVFFQNTANRFFMESKGVVKERFDILPGSGVNLEQYKLLPYPEGDTIDFLFVARIMQEKGIDQYLEAAQAVKERHPETRFHICGFCEEEYIDKLNRLSDARIIIYHGLVSEMEEIYRVISCTIHPSYYSEGLSNVLLESAASGRPIITTDRPGCREVVDDNINGFIIKERDSRDLIDKIEKFLALSFEERSRMGIAGREKIEGQFDRKIVINKYLEEMKNVRN